MITQEQVKELFEYKDGTLFWKIRPSKSVLPGDAVISIDSKGYIRVRINYKYYRAHRIIYLYHYGYTPKYIDHINGSKKDNRIENLRPCTQSENGKNAKISSRNSCGVKNVSWYKPYNKWVVRIGHNYKKIFIGYFDDLELAELVAIEAREKYNGQFARHQ